MGTITCVYGTEGFSRVSNRESGCLEWSPDGEYLAASQTQSSHIIIWESASRKKAYVQPDVKMSHVDFLCWSPESLVVNLTSAIYLKAQINGNSLSLEMRMVI